MGEIKVEMRRTRETKNKIVYTAIEARSAIESIYVHKDALTRPYPDTLTLVLQGEFSE